MKIVVIGGGSSYTPELVEGMILKKDVLPIETLVLVDVEAGLDKLQINYELVSRMFRKAGMHTRIQKTLDRACALADADFVMTQFRVGGLKARALDERIPIEHGMIGQETTGIGGFFKALRTLPVMMAICEDMEKICPDAWLINFTNPSGIITEAVLTKTKVKCIGLCNVPINMHYEAAERLNASPHHIQSNFVGLNHLSFMNQCTLDGVDQMRQVLRDDQQSKGNVVKNIEAMAEMESLSMYLGMIPSPYLHYYYYEADMIASEKEALASGLGTRAEQVMDVEKTLFESYQDPKLDHKPDALSQRGGARYSEAAIALVDSIYNNRGDCQVVNTLNRGSITDFPENVAVEVTCIINSRGATPLANGALPKSIASLIGQVKTYEGYAIEAALTGSLTSAYMALLNHPLIPSMKQGEVVFRKLCEAHDAYLPQRFLERM